MSPAERYSHCLRERERSLAQADRLHERIGAARLLLACTFLVLAWSCIARGLPAPAWLLAPSCAFAAAIVYHQRVRARRDLARRAVSFFRAGLDRLNGQPPPDGPSYQPGVPAQRAAPVPRRPLLRNHWGETGCTLVSME